MVTILEETARRFKNITDHHNNWRDCACNCTLEVCNEYESCPDCIIGRIGRFFREYEGTKFDREYLGSPEEFQRNRKRFKNWQS